MPSTNIRSLGDAGEWSVKIDFEGKLGSSGASRDNPWVMYRVINGVRVPLYEQYIELE